MRQAVVMIAGEEVVLSPSMVTWRDAFAETASWLQPDDITDEPCMVTTVGYIVPNAKADHVTIAQSVNDGGQIDSVLFVPVGMVVDVVLLS